MAGPHLDELAPLQRTVMEALWAAGRGTVAEIQTQISPDRSIPYTSILSAFQNLEKAGWVTHVTEGRQYVYSPLRSREEVGRGAVRRLVRGLFADDPFLLFRHLLDAESLTPEQLAELQQLIEQKRRAEEEEGHAGD